MVKIAFDAKRAFLNNSGLGNYSRTIIKSLHFFYPNVQQILFTPKTNEGNFVSEISKLPNIEINIPTQFIDSKIKSYWRSYSITKQLIKNNVDVYHGLSNELPVNIKQFKGKKIVTIHDLIFLRYPHLYSFIDRTIYRKKFYAACKNADVIIAISEETKNDIIDFFNISADKIKVVYQSCDDVYYKVNSEQEIEEVVKQFSLPENYLLYVGTIEERKNLLTIIKSLKEVDSLIPLVVIGKKTDYYKTVLNYISENKLNNRILFLENVSNEQLPIIYKKAAIFIYPSIFEGFGIPILEALVSKTPVITNNSGCFPEAGGPNTIYVDPLDSKKMAQKINQLLQSESLRNEIAEHGYIYAEKFKKEIIAKQLMSIYAS